MAPDMLCSLLLFDHQGRPAFLNYSEFKQTSSSLNELLKLNLYPDKTVLHEGDSLLVIVELANLSQDTLQMLDLKFVSLEFSVISNTNCLLLIAPTSSEVCDFYLKVKKIGTSNLIAKATVKKFNSTADPKSVTIIEQFEHIQIISTSRSSKEPQRLSEWINLLIGAVLGYLGNLVANTQTQKKDLKKKNASLLQNLRPQLQSFLQSVKDKKIVKTHWLEENLIALVTMAQEITPERDLGAELISLRDLLREYNEKLQGKQNDTKLINKLKTELSNIIDALPHEKTSK